MSIRIALFGILALTTGCRSPQCIAVYDPSFVDVPSVLRSASICGVPSDQVKLSLDKAFANPYRLKQWERQIYQDCRTRVPGFVDYQGIRGRLVLLEAWNQKLSDELDSLLQSNKDLRNWEARMNILIRTAALQMEQKCSP